MLLLYARRHGQWCWVVARDKKKTREQEGEEEGKKVVGAPENMKRIFFFGYLAKWASGEQNLETLSMMLLVN